MVPSQARADTREKIVEQAARLLQEEGPGALTTRGVAVAAGVQAPTIYRLFGDKDGLLDAVTEHVLATYVSTKAAADRTAGDADVDPLADLRAGWRTQTDFGVANPSLFALLSDPDRARRSPAAQAGMRVLATKVHRLALAGLLRVPESRAVELVHAAGTGAVLTILATPPAERDLTVADDMLEAVLAHVLAAPEQPASAGAGWAAAAVTLRAAAPGLEALSGAERELLSEWLERAVGRER